MSAPLSANRRLLVGLGNPGAEYAGSRHNAGWMALERLREAWKMGDWRFADAPGRVAEAAGTIPAAQMAIEIADRPADTGEAAKEDGAEAGVCQVCLLRPMSYMNRSGRELALWLQGRSFCEGWPDWSSMLVVVDDMDLPPGRVRLRAEGSDGGHNGLADITAALGTDQYPRLRVGVGRPPPGVPPVEWVLGCWDTDSPDASRDAIDQAARAAACWAARGLEAAQRLHNGGCIRA